MDKFLVLIVDDSKTVHNQITKAIKNITVENKPIELESVYSYREFKSVYEPNKYALVITDLVMETEDSGINVINHIRHTVNDTKTRIVLMTANPEKVPQELLIRDYDVNSYIEKRSMNDFLLKLTVISLLKTYKDIIAFEKAINSIEHVIQSSKEMNLEELLIEIFFQVRSFLTLKSSNIEIEGQIYLDDHKIFPPKAVSQTSKIHQKKSVISFGYLFEEEILGKHVKIIIGSSKQLSDIDKDYVKALLSNLKQSYFYTQLMDIENELVYRLANLVETRSEETGEHVKRVSEVCYLLALDFGFDKDSSLIKGASGLHDVGKVGIPDHILNKPGKLNDQEFAVMKEHTLIGFELLKNSRLKLFELGALIALQHHERWDGTGYPYGLKGEEIAPEARIVQVADVFEALTHNRCYRPAWPVDKAIEYMYDMSGKQFDPKVIEIFKKRLWDILDIFKKFKD